MWFIADFSSLVPEDVGVRQNCERVCRTLSANFERRKKTEKHSLFRGNPVVQTQVSRQPCKLSVERTTRAPEQHTTLVAGSQGSFSWTPKMRLLVTGIPWSWMKISSMTNASMLETTVPKLCYLPISEGVLGSVRRRQHPCGRSSWGVQSFVSIVPDVDGIVMEEIFIHTTISPSQVMASLICCTMSIKYCDEHLILLGCPGCTLQPRLKRLVAYHLNSNSRVSTIQSVRGSSLCPQMNSRRHSCSIST